MVSRPSVEALIAFTIVEDPNKWSIETQRNLLDSYFAKRAVKSGLHGPRVFESAMCLAMAERYRAAGQEAGARAMIAHAVDNAPGHSTLIALEASFDLEVLIIWRDILLPKDEPARKRRKIAEVGQRADPARAS